MKNSIRNKTNILVASLLILVNFFTFFGLPFIGGLWFLLWIPILIFTNTLWALTHEAIHNMFAQREWVNRLFGRLMGWSLGIEFFIARFGHMQHHRLNRTEMDISEGYDASKDSKFLKNITYYARLCFGLYLFEIVLPILFFLPKKVILASVRKLLGLESDLTEKIEHILLKHSMLNTIRFSALVMLLIWIAAFYCYGSAWWVLLVASIVRAFLISYADNLPHYGTRIDDVHYAYNLSMPWIFQKWILNFNLHRVHHQNPNLPWHLLPVKFAETNDTTEVNYFKQGLKQFKGVIDLSKLRSIQ